jgi:tetratricopeptide (TPR) repeat protein
VALPSRQPDMKAEEYLEKGKRALAGGEYDLAIQYFRQLLKQDSTQEEYRNLLSQAELERAKSQVNFITRPIYTLWAILIVFILRMHQAGLKVTRVLAKSKPGSKLAVSLYATSCMKTKNIGEAIQTYESFLREKPFHEGVLEKLSHIYYDRFDYVNAVRTLDALRKMKPEDPEISKMYDTAVTQKYTAEGTDVRKLQQEGRGKTAEDRREETQCSHPAMQGEAGRRQLAHSPGTNADERPPVGAGRCGV